MFGGRGDPLSYPGEPPNEPVILHGNRLVPLAWRRAQLVVKANGTPVDDILAQLGSAPLTGRVPQVAYGANRDLHNLAWKMQSYRDHEGVSSTVVVLPGELHDADVVACNIGYWGYIYAAALLHRPPALNRPYLAGGSVQVAVLFMDVEQMRAMHRSEGVPYNYDESRAGVSCDVAVTSCTVGVNVDIRAQLYVLSLPFMSLDGGRSPAPFATVKRSGRSTLPRYEQRELWDRVSQQLDLGDPSAVVRTLQTDALSRRAGESGASETSRALYERVRAEIVERLRLVDADGVVRTGSDGVPELLSPRRAWGGYPLLEAGALG